MLLWLIATQLECKPKNLKNTKIGGPGIQKYKILRIQNFAKLDHLTPKLTNRGDNHVGIFP